MAIAASFLSELADVASLRQHLADEPVRQSLQNWPRMNFWTCQKHTLAKVHRTVPVALVQSIIDEENVNK
jgi:hypothetical protein